MLDNLTLNGVERVSHFMRNSSIYQCEQLFVSFGLQVHYVATHINDLKDNEVFQTALPLKLHILVPIFFLVHVT